jgi:catechol 2,3-dioxygenase-like lactoylglutathione lyase family enzyme
MPSTKIFHHLHHVCIVVHDLDKAVAYYESLGVGPWHDFPSLDIYDITAKNPEAYLKLRYRYANLANYQLQLCQPAEGDTPQWQFLKQRGEGMYHLGFAVDHLDAAEKEGVRLGLDIVSKGRLDDGSGFTYFDTRDRGAAVTLEVRRSKLV